MNKSKEISNRSKFAWNMVGSMSNALASFVLLTMVTRLNGSKMEDFSVLHFQQRRC